HRPPSTRSDSPYDPRRHSPRYRPDGYSVLDHPLGRVPDRLGLGRVDVLAQDVPLLVVRLVRVGVDPGVPEPPLPPAGPPPLARLPVLRFPDPGALDRAFPPRPQRLHPAVVRALGRGQVQVPAGIRAP